MHSQQQNIRKKGFFKYSSNKKYLKIFVPDFAFKHDNDDKEGKDKFVGRDVLFRRLYTWLTSDSKSGSYLITGYRGMGKSLLVRRVIEVISREPKAYKEVIFVASIIALFFACYNALVHFNDGIYSTIILGLLSLIVVLWLYFTNNDNYYLFDKEKRKLSNHQLFNEEMIAKFFIKRRDHRENDYNIISITINLGQEVLHERDVLSLMAQSIYDKYGRFIKNNQSRPIYCYVKVGVVCLLSCVLTCYIYVPICEKLVLSLLSSFGRYSSSFLGDLSKGILLWINNLYCDRNELFLLLLYAASFWLTYKIFRIIRKHLPYFSVPYNSLERLSYLCERIKSNINESSGSVPRYSSSFLTLSLFNKSKNKTTPMANVREIEQELLSIINEINGDDCPWLYRAQFIIVFDELDKITKAASRVLTKEEKQDREGTPDFDTTVNGFTDAMAYEERKQNVLRLLANMKLFISSVNAKCVFISGHELFDASMADLSDREFAINSIFNGVLNVSSFLSPERGETDISSMTELYVATMLLPEDYLIEKMSKNSSDNHLLKEEQPSLRWYYEYLMEKHILNVYNDNDEDREEREEEIKYAIEFLRYFTVFLSHISNGSPKKIATYFEKYIKTNYDAIRQFDWSDEIVIGEPSETNVRKQCVLYFDDNSQRLINFIYYIASPVMNAITNEVSNYGDKLMVSSSFILDQIYKYHGKGFSWRNLEQMPELLTSNKNPELRDSMASIVEFLQHIHMTNISFGIFQYKFYKQISEEISAISKVSEEAAAIFNFTLNESETVKRYNTRLLNHYMALAASKPEVYKYKDILERIHENQGDIFFSEEDYYRAIHEYRSALQYIPLHDNSVNSVISHLKCGLKIGMSYEYRKTYETAYIMYCELINKLIHLHWMEEDELGLDYTMRLSRDWRVKKTVLVNKDTFKNKFDYKEEPKFRRQFNAGLWEDVKDICGVLNPQYSLDSDRTISGLSTLYTPEKSDLFEKLTAFEDVRYVYQAIIAKLFVIEKMQVSGITQSSIEEAEAEFMTLYSDTNIDEKFVMAADFFSKMSEILYYKNNYVIANKLGNLASALYKFDYNVFTLLDDYCFVANAKCTDNSAIEIKDDVRLFFNVVELQDVIDANNNVISFTDLFVDADDPDKNPKPYFYGSKFKEKVKKIRPGINHESFIHNVKNYLDYLSKTEIFDIHSKWLKIKDCSECVTVFNKVGCKLPCNACKYVHRSLVILMNNMFRSDCLLDIDYPKAGKSYLLLKYTSHKFVKYLRQSQISLLASTSEQLANVLLSCSSTYIRKDEGIKKFDSEISIEVLQLLIKLSGNDLDETKREAVLKHYGEAITNKERINAESTNLYKLDRVLLYYWAACRYYEIASMYKEAEQCIERILKVLEDYLTIINYKNTTDKRKSIVKQIYISGDIRFQLIENLFKKAATIIRHQYESFDMAEIHRHKWLFHMEQSDDIDLIKLSIFPNLQTVFNAAINCKVLCLQYLKKSKGVGIPDIDEQYRNYIAKVYNRVAPAMRHEKTFKGEVESNYMKARLNHMIFVDIIGADVLKNERDATHIEDNKHKPEHHKAFYSRLSNYLANNYSNRLDKYIFDDTQSVDSKLDVLNYLVQDSMICLINILKVLTPYNHITTFSNSFVADVYDMLWEWSKYYELLYDLYLYYRYDEEHNELKKQEVVVMSSRNTNSNSEVIDKLLRKCVKLLRRKNVRYKDEFGYLYSKLLHGIRHGIDDSAIHHIYTNYSAEMAIKYYKIARDINSEGSAYKDLIGNMYVLNDDLHNDTCRFNLADERYFLNSGVIYTKRRQLEKMYEKTNTNRMKSYEKAPNNNNAESFIKMLTDRFEDSLYINTEY